jgi:hypothetical protein
MAGKLKSVMGQNTDTIRNIIKILKVCLVEILKTVSFCVYNSNRTIRVGFFICTNH